MTNCVLCRARRYIQNIKSSFDYQAKNGLNSEMDIGQEITGSISVYHVLLF